MKKLTEYEPERRFTIAEDGFHGTYYKPEVNKYPDKVLILFGGSAGKFLLSEMCAEKYYENGLNVIAVAYRDVPGAPSQLHGIPLELIEKAILWGKENVGNKVIVNGISLGGQLALLLGSYFPDLVSGVVAINPMHFSQQGMKSFKALEFTPNACFTLRGEDLPYYPVSVSTKEFQKQLKKDARKSHEFMNCAEFYRREIKLMDNDAPYMIPVEKSKAAILLLSGGQDVMLPSQEICEKVVERLEKYHYSYPYKHLYYEIASHYLCPAKPLTAKLFRIERKEAKKCDLSRKQALEDTLKFIEEI